MSNLQVSCIPKTDNCNFKVFDENGKIIDETKYSFIRIIEGGINGDINGCNLLFFNNDDPKQINKSFDVLEKRYQLSSDDKKLLQSRLKAKQSKETFENTKTIINDNNRPHAIAHAIAQDSNEDSTVDKKDSNVEEKQDNINVINTAITINTTKIINQMNGVNTFVPHVLHTVEMPRATQIQQILPQIQEISQIPPIPPMVETVNVPLTNISNISNFPNPSKFKPLVSNSNYYNHINNDNIPSIQSLQSLQSLPLLKTVTKMNMLENGFKIIYEQEKCKMAMIKQLNETSIINFPLNSLQIKAITLFEEINNCSQKDTPIKAFTDFRKRIKTDIIKCLDKKQSNNYAHVKIGKSFENARDTFMCTHRLFIKNVEKRNKIFAKMIANVLYGNNGNIKIFGVYPQIWYKNGQYTIEINCAFICGNEILQVSIRKDTINDKWYYTGFGNGFKGIINNICFGLLYNKNKQEIINNITYMDKPFHFFWNVKVLLVPMREH